MENPNDQENNYFIKKEKKEEEKKKNETARKAKKFIKVILWILIPAAMIGGFIWYMAKTTPENSNLSGDLNTCTQHTSIGMHIHPHLTITIDGQDQKIPSNIGVSSICMRPIHTHDGSGTLHLEFNKPRDVRLGELFQVWEKEFNSARILDYYNAGDKKVRLFVNGVENFDFENYIMRDKDKIEIKYESRT